MKTAFATFLFLVLTGTLNASSGGQDRDERRENRKEHGREQQAERSRRENGEHRGWEQAAHPHANWDSEHDRIRPGRPYPYGRYEHGKAVIAARHFDARTRRVILYDNSNWVMAAYDIPRCRDWDWDRDRVYVYDDDHHPGWYLLFNARLGRYVHVEYFGLH